MTTFEIAETWVERNHAKESKEEKEKLALVFISGMAEGQRISPNTLEELITNIRDEVELLRKSVDDGKEHLTQEQELGYLFAIADVHTILDEINP